MMIQLFIHLMTLCPVVFSPLAEEPSAYSPPPNEASEINNDFWAHWGDGQAELCGYECKISRYGTLRSGTTVSIFVTETFAEKERVKSDPEMRPKDQEFPVLKLNLIQDFSTGIYDYNVMSSTFMSLSPRNGRPSHSPTKISFSAQEWCGHAYHQLLFDPSQIRNQFHSYFDGEGDYEGTLGYPRGGLCGDSLWHWARGLASPTILPGESKEVPYLPTLGEARFKHKPLEWTQAVLARSETQEQIEVPAGSFLVRSCSLAVLNRQTVTLFVEEAIPHRIVRFESTSGDEGSLLGSARLKYWEMSGPGFETALAKIGMKPRPERTQ